MEHPRSQQQTYGIGLLTIIRSYTNPRVHSYRWYPQSDSEERNRHDHGVELYVHLPV
jgi:hypothetical protein